MSKTQLSPKDLRIGNTILINDTIYNLELPDLNLIVNRNGKSTYSPIPLTADILLKCGFYKCDDSWYFSLDFAPNANTFKIFPLTSGGEPNGMWAIAGMPQLYKKLEYLHQIQNLFFALTGEELTFNN